MTLMNRLFKVRQAVLGVLLLATLILLAGCGGGVDEGDLTVPRIQMDTSRIYSPVFEDSLDNITFYVEPGVDVKVEPSETTALVSGLTQLATSQTIDAESTELWDVWSFSLTDLAPGSNQIFITAEDAAGNTNSLLFIPQYARLTIENYNSSPQGDTQTIRGLIAPGMMISKITLDDVEQALPSDQVPFTELTSAVSTWSFGLDLAGDTSAVLTVYVNDDGEKCDINDSNKQCYAKLTFTMNDEKPNLSIDNADLIQSTNSVTLTGTVTAPYDEITQDTAWLEENLEISFPNLGDDETELPTVDTVSYDSTSQTWSALISNLKPGLTRILVDYTDPAGNTAAAHGAILVQE